MTRVTLLRVALLAALISVPTAAARAQITWDWSFGTNAGQFTTDGNAPGGVAAPGNYNFVDFLLSSSGDGAAVGSVSGGTYTAGGFSTNLPYDFTWDGSAVTFWNSAGINSFDWWVFTDNTQSDNWIFFAWAQCNVNDATQAAHYTGNLCQESQTVTVSVAGSTSTVPEPATFGLLALGLFGVGIIRRRSSRAG